MAREAVLLAIQAATNALNGLGTTYALIGGAALPAWGPIRATADADILISIGPSLQKSLVPPPRKPAALLTIAFAPCPRIRVTNSARLIPSSY